MSRNPSWNVRGGVSEVGAVPPLAVADEIGGYIAIHAHGELPTKIASLRSDAATDYNGPQRTFLLLIGRP